MDEAEPSALLDRVAQAIADGQPISWDDVAAGSDSREDFQLLQELRVLAAVAAVHRGVEESAGADEIQAAATPDLDRWGPFQLLQPLGRGTFGVVYRARDIRLDRDVALKILNGRHADHRSAVVAEGRLLAKLRHQNIITVFGAEVFNGVAGIWMELLQGRTLEEEIFERGMFGAQEAALVGIDLCRALAAVHRAGLVHRDVKAQNVMREAGGRIVLMDFGAGEDREDAAAATTLKGTPLYMAPEVLAGGPATPSSDLYSLGVLLYRLVTNEFPAYASTLDDLKAHHATGTRRHLRDVRPDLPSSFIRSIETAIEASPDLRPSTAAGLERSLVSVLGPHAGGIVPAEGRSWSRWWGTMSAVMLTMFLAGWAWWGPRSPAAPAPAGIRSLVVLPFRNLSGEAGQDYLADGVTEILIGNLAQLRPLRVISRTSAMAYRGTNKPLSEVAHELKVEGVVEGSVARYGDRLRVTVQLLRSNEEHIWGQSYDRPTADLFKVQGEISGMVADAIELSLTPAQRQGLQAGPTVKVKAQDAFLRGMQRLNDPRAESLKLALSELLEATSLDPTFARAFASLSQCYLFLGGREIVPHDEAYARALTAATRALQLDDSVSEAHTELAEVKFYYEWDWVAARQRYERALELNPSNSHAMARYALFLSALGRPDEAVRLAVAAQALDPLSSTVRFVPGMALFYARRYEESVEAFEKLAQLPPYTLTPSDRIGLARAYAARGEYQRAIDEITTAIRQGGELTPWVAELARVRAASGDRPAASQLLATLLRDGSADRVAAANLAFLYAALGNVEEAFRQLNIAADQRAPVLLWANVDPRLDSLRKDARYRLLTARIGLPN